VPVSPAADDPAADAPAADAPAVDGTVARRRATEDSATIGAARGPGAPTTGRLAGIRDSRLALWCAFAVVHLALAVVVFASHHLGDVVGQYLPWAQRAVEGRGIVGIDEPWVYPVVALVPLLLPMVFGAAAYGLCWIVMITALDAIAVAVLAARPGAGRRAVWWWMLFLLLLGPIALVRLDSVSVPLALLGVVWLATRPRTALVLLTVATWLKFWPAAVLASVFIALRHRIRTVVTVLVTSAVLVVVPLLLGGGRYLLSFIGTQSTRALQVEAPVATPWLWAAAAHLLNAQVYYDAPINTWEVTGQGTVAAMHLMMPLLAFGVLVTAALGVLATRRRGADALPELMLALVVVFITFNKVLSPQYITWIAVPIVYGLLQHGRRFRVPAVLALAIALLTQGYYPWLYKDMLHGGVVPALILGLRNVALFVLLGWAIVRLCRRRTPAPTS
jgi:hypothetical protein